VSLVEWPERLQESAPQQHLQLRIAIMEEDAQQALAAEGVGSAGARNDGSGVGQQGGVSRGEGGVAGAGSLDGSKDGVEEDEDEEDEVGDGRWRRMTLVPFGDRWQQRLGLLQSFLRNEGRQHGCWLQESDPPAL
jgi:hypothetical protein